MKVYIMIGLAGSGKSSWARWTAKCDFNTIRICLDDIRNMIKDGYVFDYQLEPMVRDMGVALIEQVLLAGKNVIVDECNLLREHRQQLCAKIKEISPETEIIYVWVKCPWHLALQRRLINLRGGTKMGWTLVLKKMVAVFEEPLTNECGDDITIKVVNNE
jgi:predicted kinase